MDKDGQNIEKLTSNFLIHKLSLHVGIRMGEKSFLLNQFDGNLDLYTMIIENGEKTQITNSSKVITYPFGIQMETKYLILVYMITLLISTHMILPLDQQSRIRCWRCCDGYSMERNYINYYRNDTTYS